MKKKLWKPWFNTLNFNYYYVLYLFYPTVFKYINKKIKIKLNIKFGRKSIRNI